MDLNHTCSLEYWIMVEKCFGYGYGYGLGDDSILSESGS